MLRSVNEKNYLKTWWILNYSEHLIYTLSPRLDKVSYVYINPDKSEPQKSHDYRHVNVSKKVCFQNVLYPASNLSRGSEHGGGGGGATILSTFHPSAPPARRELARSVLRPYWTAKSTFSNDLFIFKTVCLKKLHGYAGIHHWSSQKGVYLAWTLYLAWSGVPPPPLQSITYF